MLPYLRLTRRRDFLAAASRGRRHASHTLVVQHVPHPEPALPILGLTVTRKIGNAAVRNRVKRKLRAVFAAAASSGALPSGHYVVIARQGAFEAPATKLAQDLRYCIRKITT